MQYVVAERKPQIHSGTRIKYRAKKTTSAAKALKRYFFILHNFISFGKSAAIIGHTSPQVGFTGPLPCDHRFYEKAVIMGQEFFAQPIVVHLIGFNRISPYYRFYSFAAITDCVCHPRPADPVKMLGIPD